MRWIAVAAGVLLVASVLAGSEEEVEKGALNYTLEVNGQPHPIEPGKLLTLPAQEGPLKLMLKVAGYRVFRARGVEFRFPRGGDSHRNTLAESEEWWIRMRGFTLSIWIEREESNPADLIDQGVERIEGKIIVRNDRPLRLGGKEVGGTTHMQEGVVGWVKTHYALRTGPDTVMFVFAEARTALPGEPSEEWREMERWLQKSLKVLPPTDK